MMTWQQTMHLTKSSTKSHLTSQPWFQPTPRLQRQQLLPELRRLCCLRWTVSCTLMRSCLWGRGLCNLWRWSMSSPPSLLVAPLPRYALLHPSCCWKFTRLLAKYLTDSLTPEGFDLVCVLKMYETERGICTNSGWLSNMGAHTLLALPSQGVC